ncbi:MAG: hypothetical protein MUC59_09050 [Saprospiraceae bacterium]|jgi:hypothetical protein|nr:hypothetical protein [Saprospiraceae bacterium]
MSTEVNKAIQELLYEQTAVIVPGLGGFTSTPGAATVDYVQDVITPPSSKLDFNPNLVINDGVLVQYLQKTNLSTYQEAEVLVHKFVEQVRETLERREIFEIPKVGRLYQDYEHKIRFMPEGTNFNAASFGLPTVEFQPLVKEKTKPIPQPNRPSVGELAEAAAESGAAVAAAPVVEDTPTSLFMKMLPWLVLLVAILMALAIYNMVGGKQADTPDEPVAIDRVNVKPSTEDTAKPAAPAEEPEETAAATPSAPAETTEEETAPIAQQNTPPATVQKPAVTPKPAPPAVKEPAPTTKQDETAGSSKKQVYLVVHSFGVKGNATKFASTLKGDGYRTQTKQVGGLHRVGVLLSYDSPEDIESARKILANKYKAGPKTEKELEEMEGN